MQVVQGKESQPMNNDLRVFDGNGFFMDATMKSVIDALSERYGIKAERIEQLLKAEQDSNVVVLPKVGDRLFYAPYPKGTTGYDGEFVFLRNTGDGSGMVRRVDVLVMFDNWAGGVPIKRTWRTKEEAENKRALAERESVKKP